MARILLISALLASCLIAVNAGYGYAAPGLKTCAFGCEAPLLLKKPFIPIVKLIENSDNYGNYNFDSEGGDGTRASEVGAINQVGGSVKSGSYSYISPEGIPITTSWTADENGFHAEGAHLPVPPPAPVEIQRMLHTLPANNDYYNHEVLIKEAPAYGYGAPALRFAEPLGYAAPLALPVAPVKTFVSTGDFLIDSDNSKTIVKIGSGF